MIDTNFALLCMYIEFILLEIKSSKFYVANDVVLHGALKLIR